MIIMALLLGTAIGFGICTIQSHAVGSPPDGQPPSTSEAPTFTGPVTYSPASAAPTMSQPVAVQAIPAQAVPMQAAFTGTPMLAVPTAQSAAPQAQADMSTASGDFVNSQGILYTRTVLPAPEYPVNPNWTISRNGLIGNPPVDPPSCQGRAYSTPLN